MPNLLLFTMECKIIHDTNKTLYKNIYFNLSLFILYVDYLNNTVGLSCQCWLVHHDNSWGMHMFVCLLQSKLNMPFVQFFTILNDTLLHDNTA